MKKTFLATFSISEPGRYSSTTFIGGYGGAGANCDENKSIVINIEAKSNLEIARGLEKRLNQESWKIAGKYSPRYLVSLVSVVPI